MGWFGMMQENFIWYGPATIVGLGRGGGGERELWCAGRASVRAGPSIGNHRLMWGLGEIQNNQLDFIFQLRQSVLETVSHRNTNQEWLFQLKNRLQLSYFFVKEEKLAPVKLEYPGEPI